MKRSNKMSIGTVVFFFIMAAGAAQAQQTEAEAVYYRTLDNRERMVDAVNNTGISDKDQAKVVEYVIQDEEIMNSERLRESDISDEAFNQLRDDARFD